MDTTLAAALSTALTGVADGAIDVLISNLPIAFTLVVSAAVLFFGIRTFRAMAHI